MVNWNNVKLVYGEITLDHIAPHKVSLSEVHNVLDGYFIPTRISLRNPHATTMRKKTNSFK